MWRSPWAAIGGPTLLNNFGNHCPFAFGLAMCRVKKSKNRLAIDRPMGKRGFPGRETWTTRRNFLTAAARPASPFECSLLDAAHAQPKAAAPAGEDRRQALKTIDVHSHCLFHEALDLLGPDKDKPLPRPRPAGALIAVEQRLKAMDAMAIDMEIPLDQPVLVREGSRPRATDRKVQNEKLASCGRRSLNRFGAFASLSLQFPDLACSNWKPAIQEAGPAGCPIGGSVLGEDFPIQISIRLGQGRRTRGVLFVHPQRAPELGKRFRAMAGCPIRSAIPSTPRSRCNT